MNSKLFFGIIAFAVSTFTPAMAADVSIPYKAAPAAIPVFSWTGCYVGGNGGGGRGFNQHQPLSVLGIDSFNAVHNSGWFAGVQGGCDYQVGSLVVGVEAQFDWADIKGTATTFIPGSAVGIVLTSKVDRFATATGRVGYAFDRILFYAKGGAAFAHINQQFTLTDFATALIPFTGAQDIAGFVVGAGFEFALLPNVSLKAEYNYFDFGRNGVNLNCTGPLCGGPAGLPLLIPVDIRQNMQTAMLGVNYRFGLGPLMR